MTIEKLLLFRGLFVGKVGVINSNTCTGNEHLLVSHEVEKDVTICIHKVVSSYIRTITADCGVLHYCTFLSWFTNNLVWSERTFTSTLLIYFFHQNTSIVKVSC